MERNKKSLLSTHKHLLKCFDVFILGALSKHYYCELAALLNFAKSRIETFLAPI